MHSSKLKKISVALCAALLPISVFAAGLGKLNVQSGIGEPLKADIELLSVSPEELASISAAIASEEAYATQGIERPASHNTIKVSVAKNSSGTPILKLNSIQPISEPFLDMLLQVDWNSGRLLREYTVLLDPPGYAGESSGSLPSSAGTQSPKVKPLDPDTGALVADEASASTKKGGRKHKKVKPLADTEASPSAGAEATGEEYVTQKGDTLAAIANRMRPEGVSMEQMLVGLYQANPDAFSGNMNRLNVGKIIRQPSADELNAISQKQAAKEIRVQTADWHAYRNKLAGMVADAAPADAEASGQSSSGKIKTATDDQSAPAGNGPKDVVKLSSGDAASADTKSLQAKVAALQEEVTAREKGLKEAQDRTAALEKQIADMQKLLALKNNAMNDIQKQAAADTAKPAVEPAKPAEPTPPAAEAPKPAEPAAEATKPADAQPAETPSAEPAKPAEATPAAEPAKPVEPVKKPVVVPPPPAPAPVEEPGFIDSMTSGLDPMILGGGAGLIALLGGGWAWLRGRRKKNLADFEQGIMTSGGLKANTVFGNTSSSSVDTGDTSFLTDFSQSASGGMIDTNDVDPIAEAEVYMAYGRDAQAEEILKDAISKEPKRYELHLKLLEMYAASKNMSAFETVSGELYTTLGADDPTWAKVAEIGIKLEPNNPLYQAGASPTGGASTANAADTSGKLDANDFSSSPLASEQDLISEEKDMDFSFGNDDLNKDFAAADEDSPLQFDTLEEEPPKAQVAAMGVAAVAAAESAMEFTMPEAAKEEAGALDFDMGQLTAKADAAPEAPSFGNTTPDLNFGSLEAPAAEVEAAPVFEAASTFDEIPTFESVAEEAPTFESVTEAVADLPAFDFNTEEPAVAQTDASFETIDFSAPQQEPGFGFDVTTISPEMDKAADTASLDLSGISLEMDDSAPALDMGGGGDEPAEVETKLELVAAYIDMDDKEGAKELLAEVMKEGGAGQRKRAETLLSQLG